MTSSSPAACSPLTIKALSSGEVFDKCACIDYAIQTVQRIGRTFDALSDLVHKIEHCSMQSSFLGFGFSTLRFEVPPPTDGVDGPIGIVIVTRSAGAKVFTIASSANDVSHINIYCSLLNDKPDTLSVVAQVVYNPASGRFPSAVLLEHSDVVGFDAVFVAERATLGAEAPVGHWISATAPGSDGGSDSVLPYMKEVTAPMRVQLMFNLNSVTGKPFCSFVAAAGLLTGSVLAARRKYV